VLNIIAGECNLKMMHEFKIVSISLPKQNIYCHNSVWFLYISTSSPTSKLRVPVYILSAVDVYQRVRIRKKSAGGDDGAAKRTYVLCEVQLKCEVLRSDVMKLLRILK